MRPAEDDGPSLYGEAQRLLGGAWRSLLVRTVVRLATEEPD